MIPPLPSLSLVIQINGHALNRPRMVKYFVKISSFKSVGKFKDNKSKERFS